MGRKSAKAAANVAVIEQPTLTSTTSNIHVDLNAELYRTFDFFNQLFTEGKLPRPVITIATKGRASAHGWFAHSTWKNSNSGEILHEIQMCAENFRRPHYEVIGTLVHEMAHLANFVENDNKVVDCTPQQRHNKIFKKKAEEYLLTVTSSARFGSGHTECSPALIDMIDSNLQPKTELYTIYRDNFQENEEKKKYVSKLKPIMVGAETKELIEKAAEEMGMSQKDLANAAINSYVKMQTNAKAVAEEIFAKLKKFKSAVEIEAILIDALMLAPEQPKAEEGGEEAGEDSEEK